MPPATAPSQPKTLLPRLRRGALALAGLVATYIGVLAYPEPAFAYRIQYRQFDLWSDRPIDSSITVVLDDAIRRLQTSSLYTPQQRFHVFFCNARWRLQLYGLFHPGVGGIVIAPLTSNIYLRESDIPHDRIIPPHAGPMADAKERPLAYYIAHEATHVMQGRSFGRFFALTRPTWLNEGYADLVGKGGDFDMRDNLARLQAHDPSMDVRRSGLYRLYHLEVAWMLGHDAVPLETLYAHPPAEKKLLARLREARLP